MTAGRVWAIVGGFLHAIHLNREHFPAHAPEEKNVTWLRVHVGLDSRKLGSAGGDLPDVRVYNEVGTRLGLAFQPGPIASGEFVDVNVTLSENQQPTYVMLVGNEDAVCVSYVTQTWADGGRYGWVGNWGKTCKSQWYYSNVLLDGRPLECTWIDKHRKDGRATAIAVHMNEFAKKPKKNGTEVYWGPDNTTNKKRISVCDNPPVLNFYNQTDPTELATWGQSRDNDTYRPRPYPLAAAAAAAVEMPQQLSSSETRLVSSKHAAHSAVELCADPTSSGPDFVSEKEGLLCHMATRELFPLCKRPGTTEAVCFDEVDGRFRAPGDDGGRRRDLEDKVYTEVIRWGPGEE